MIVDRTYDGPEGVTESDRLYAGSRFSEVRAALFAIPTTGRGEGRANHRSPSMTSRSAEHCVESSRSAMAGLSSRPPEGPSSPRRTCAGGPMAVAFGGSSIPTASA